MVDKLEGTWKSDNSKTQGFNELMSTLGFAQDEKETGQLRDNATIMTHKKLDDGYWVSSMTVGDYKDEVKWKIGEEYETKTILGGKTKATPVLEGNTIVEVHTLNTDKKEFKIYVRTTVNGDVITSEMEWHLIIKLNKCYNN